MVPKLSCVYCGRDIAHADWMEHTRICEKHPLRDLQRRCDRQNADITGLQKERLTLISRNRGLAKSIDDRGKDLSRAKAALDQSHRTACSQAEHIKKFQEAQDHNVSLINTLQAELTAVKSDRELEHNCCSGLQERLAIGTAKYDSLKVQLDGAYDENERLQSNIDRRVALMAADQKAIQELVRKNAEQDKMISDIREDRNDWRASAEKYIGQLIDVSDELAAEKRSHKGTCLVALLVCAVAFGLLGTIVRMIL